MADKSEWKTPSMEGEGKGDGHQYRRKPRTPKPISIAGNSPSEEAMGHWTPMGIEPMDYDDDVYMYVYMYMYIHMYMYIYIMYIYIYIYIQHIKGINVAKQLIERLQSTGWFTL